MQASKAIASELPDCIAQCRSILLVRSRASVSSGWVREEYNYAVGQRTQHAQFQIIPVRIEDCPVPGFLETTKWIDLPSGELAPSTFSEILHSFYNFDVALDLQTTRDVYVSRSWRESEARLPDQICRAFVEAGFRLIGDSQDQAGFGEGDRVATIMSSCGGFLAIVPHRGEGQTSRHILDEIGLARSQDLPGVVVAHPDVRLPDATGLTLLRTADQTELQRRPDFARAIQELGEHWRKPASPHYAFFATDLGSSNLMRNRAVQQLVQCVTAMPCILGEDVRAEHLQKEIRDRIAGAFIMVADISRDNLNTCIEAGIARGTGTRLHLVAQEPRHRPPFMFRDLQVFHYEDDTELLAVIHRVLHPYRRRVLNYELE
ncbi:MAG: TIR domain-containing protein [Candidatus Eisenbacteria bacterium]|nr:TIR domain-containing protein [Candidatus Eisenbacteria bacterium]